MVRPLVEPEVWDLMLPRVEKRVSTQQSSEPGLALVQD